MQNFEFQQIKIYHVIWDPAKIDAAGASAGLQSNPPDNSLEVSKLPTQKTYWPQATNFQSHFLFSLVLAILGENTLWHHTWHLGDMKKFPCLRHHPQNWLVFLIWSWFSKQRRDAATLELLNQKRANWRSSHLWKTQSCKKNPFPQMINVKNSSFFQKPQKKCTFREIGTLVENFVDIPSLSRPISTVECSGLRLRNRHSPVQWQNHSNIAPTHISSHHVSALLVCHYRPILFSWTTSRPSPTFFLYYR